jgi:hypothetical protein
MKMKNRFINLGFTDLILAFNEETRKGKLYEIDSLRDALIHVDLKRLQEIETAFFKENSFEMVFRWMFEDLEKIVRGEALDEANIPYNTDPYNNCVRELVDLTSIYKETKGDIFKMEDIAQSIYNFYEFTPDNVAKRKGADATFDLDELLSFIVIYWSYKFQISRYDILEAVKSNFIANY